LKKFAFQLRSLSEEAQDRVSQILERIKTLSDSEALRLIKTFPVDDLEVERAVFARDPGGIRYTDPIAARQILMMQAVLGERTDEVLAAWDRALGPR
jgi:hypothetical protein